MRQSLRSFWAEPAIAVVPDRQWWDYLMAAVLAMFGVVGAFLEEDVLAPPLAAVLAAALATLVLWRRSHPLVVVVVGFGVQAAADVVALLWYDQSMLVEGTVTVGLVLTYSLFRWASGRQATIGMGVVLVTHVITELNDSDGFWLNITVGTTLWLFPAALGLVLRYRASLHERRTEAARRDERQQLARELHDTVAHHVSAIVISAQAGRAVAAQNPEAAVDSLTSIEGAASRALAEMRQLVGVLRDDTTAGELAPQPGIDDLAALADANGTSPPVDVEIVGDFDGLSPAVSASVYRLVQEAITNARRHARRATRVSVSVTADADDVHLVVTDDGDPQPSVGGEGFGLVGMSERAQLLGGRFRAGPRPGRGWSVEATLPRAVAAR
ncbi:MAG: sensor histidine kinase [Acidimicrobiales bacterium]